MREAGGSVAWDDIGEVVGFSLRPDDGLAPDRSAPLARLPDEQRSNSSDIAFWLSQGGAA